ncbi:MAG: hypothetical protein AAF192_08685 [Pseudomonadota bacterium]
MTRKPKRSEPPLRDDQRPPGVRQRWLVKAKRWRVWWEPTRAVAKLGFKPVDLDADRPHMAIKRGKQLNRLVEDRIAGRAPDLPGARGRTLDDAIAAYQASPHWRDGLAEATRRDYRKGFRILAERWGATPLAYFRRGVVREYWETAYEKRGPRMAQALIRHLSILLGYAVQREWIDANPANGVRMTTPPPRDRVVDWQEYDALLAAGRNTDNHGMVLAIKMAFVTGQRQTDILQAAASDFAMIEDWRLDGTARPAAGDETFSLSWGLHRSKTGRSDWLRLHAEVADDVAEAVQARIDAGNPHGAIVRGLGGRAFTADGFRANFTRLRARAASRVPSVATLMFRDLRRSASTHARDGGADMRDTADMLGNDAAVNPRLSRTYVPPSSAAANRAIGALRRPEPIAPRGRRGNTSG